MRRNRLAGPSSYTAMKTCRPHDMLWVACLRAHRCALHKEIPARRLPIPRFIRLPLSQVSFTHIVVPAHHVFPSPRDALATWLGGRCNSQACESPLLICLVRTDLDLTITEDLKTGRVPHPLWGRKEPFEEDGKRVGLEEAL